MDKACWGKLKRHLKTFSGCLFGFALAFLLIELFHGVAPPYPRWVRCISNLCALWQPPYPARIRQPEKRNLAFQAAFV